MNESSVQLSALIKEFPRKHSRFKRFFYYSVRLDKSTVRGYTPSERLVPFPRANQLIITRHPHSSRCKSPCATIVIVLANDKKDIYIALVSRRVLL